MTQLQKIVAKAKSLKKLYPNTKWTDLIKKASKLVTPAKKSVSGIKRTIVKKSAPAIPLIKKRIVSKSDFAMAGVKKKKATKKAVKKSPARSMHKDTKSHNVNIRVMSGVNDKYLDDLNKWVKLSKSYQSDLLLWKDKLKAAKKYKVPDAIKTYTGYVNLYTRELKNIKQHIAQLKKHIK
jgi:hypothetical protein